MAVGLLAPSGLSLTLPSAVLRQGAFEHLEADGEPGPLLEGRR